jgi:hypothetical protein
MRGIWRQRNEFDQLERELRSERPSPRPEYLANLATQLRAERSASSHRPAMRYRVVVAVAMTSLLGVVGAASGGLKYANAASTHTVKAVSHVFVSNSHQFDNRGGPGQVGNGPGNSNNGPGNSNNGPGNSNNGPGNGNNGQGNGNNGHGNGNGNNGDNHGRGDDDNAARHQYVAFVFVCLRVPPRHPFIFITLRLPKLAADALVARGLATAGAC